MADGDDPVRPRPPTPPVTGQPLPRLWKSDAEPDDEEKPARKSRRERLAEEKEKALGGTSPSKPKAKFKPAGSKGKVNKDGKKPKGALIEETPESETFETRQRVRILIGTGLIAIFVVSLVSLLRSLQGNSLPEPTGPDEGALVAAPPLPKPYHDLEQEAQILLSNAEGLAKNGNTKVSIAVLEKIVKTYPKTATAVAAREALDRPAKNLPLFLDRPTVVASPSAPSPAPPVAPAPVVTVAPATSPAIGPGGNAEAKLDLLPNPADAARSAPPPSTSAAATSSKPLPAGFRARTEAGVHGSGWPNQIISDRDGATMVLIPAGTFIQGRDDGAAEEGPEHKVTLGAFYVDQHEVTVRQYAVYLRETGGKPQLSKPAAKGESPSVDADELPVVNITAREAKSYCEWAGKRLPTEAQWEAAARTTDGRPFPWGANPPIWGRSRAPRQLDPVMSFPLDQSPYGAFDLAGNAWEYTKDYYDPHYYQQFKGRVADNPTGPAASRARAPQVVVKGVSKTWLVSARDGLKVDGRFPYVGFRGVLPVEGQTASTPNSPAPLPNQPGGISPF